MTELPWLSTEALVEIDEDDLPTEESPVILLSLLAFVLPRVPWEEVEELVDDVEAGRATEEEVLQVLPAVLDAVIPFDELVAGPVGHLLEAIDDQVARAVAKKIYGLAKKRRARAANAPRRGIFHKRQKA